MIKVYETIDEIPWLRIRFKGDSRIGLIVASNDKDKILTEYRSRVKPSENKHLKLDDSFPVFKKFRDIESLIVAFYSLNEDGTSNGEVVSIIDNSIFDIGDFSRTWSSYNQEIWLSLSEYDTVISDNSPIDMEIVDQYENKDHNLDNSENIGMKFDSGKLRYGLVPHIAFKGLAEVLTFGADKYAPSSWQTVPNGKERYLDALYRHIEAYRSGEILDSESGLSHLSHAMTNCAFLLHFQDEELNAKA